MGLCEIILPVTLIYLSTVSIHVQVLLPLTWEGHIAVRICERGVDILYPLHTLPTAQSDSHLVNILLPVHKHIWENKTAEVAPMLKQKRNLKIILFFRPSWCLDRNLSNGDADIFKIK